MTIHIDISYLSKLVCSSRGQSGSPKESCNTEAISQSSNIRSQLGHQCLTREYFQYWSSTVHKRIQSVYSDIPSTAKNVLLLSYRSEFNSFIQSGSTKRKVTQELIYLSKGCVSILRISNKWFLGGTYISQHMVFLAVDGLTAEVVVSNSSIISHFWYWIQIILAIQKLRHCIFQRDRNRITLLHVQSSESIETIE